VCLSRGDVLGRCVLEPYGNAGSLYALAKETCCAACVREKVPIFIFTIV